MKNPRIANRDTSSKAAKRWKIPVSILLTFSMSSIPFVSFANSPDVETIPQETVQTSDQTEIGAESEKPKTKQDLLVEQFIKTGKLKLEDFKHINIKEIRKIDPKLADKLQALKDKLEKEEADRKAAEEAAKGEESNKGEQGSTSPVKPDDPANPAKPDDSTDPADPADPNDPDNPNSNPTTPATCEDEGSTSKEEQDAQDEAIKEQIEDLESQLKDEQALKAQAEATAKEAAMQPLEADLFEQQVFQPSDLYPEWSYSGDTTFQMQHYTDDWNTEKFIAVIGEQARQVAQDHDVYASTLIAKAILDSNVGIDSIAKENMNLYGITFGQLEALKSDAEVSFKFTEDELAEIEHNPTPAIHAYDSQLVAYDTFADCMNDAALLQISDASDASMVRKLLGATQLTAASLLAEGTADPDAYADAITSLISTYDLGRFDSPLDYEPNHSLMTKQVNTSTGEMIQVESTLADLVAEVTSHLGVPYLWGGTTPSGFDCSGLVQYSYKESLGIGTPRTTYVQCTQGQDVDFKDLHQGDLLFFARNGVVGHVGMYLGDGYYIEAPRPNSEVKVTAMDEKTPTFAKRLISTHPTDGIGSDSSTKDTALNLASAKLANSNNAFKNQLSS